MAEESESERRFQRAAESMRRNTSLSLDNEQKLQLYGYYKQASEGSCNTPKPGFFDFTGRAKWEAWNKLKEMSNREAMERYIALVSALNPTWESVPLDLSTTPVPAKEPSSGGTGGPVMSRMAVEEEEQIPEERKTVFDWCKEGNIARLAALVTEQNVNEKDSQGMVLLHWGCDRGQVEVVKCLVSKGADINIQDTDLQTPLHYASSCDHHEVVAYLLSLGADKTLKDCDGYTPEEVANESSIKELFQQHS